MIPLFDAIISFLKNFSNFLLRFVFAISAFFIIYLGIKFYTTKGSKDIEKNKKALVYIILGLIILSILFINPKIIEDVIKIISPFKK